MVKPDNRIKGFINFTMLIIGYGILLSAVVRAAFFTKEVNVLENKNTEKLIAPTYERIQSSEFQDNVELVFNEQFPFSEQIKRVYYLYQNRVSFYALKYVSASFPNEPVSLTSSMDIYDGIYMVSKKTSLANNKDKIDRFLNCYNKQFEQCHDVRFYLYYIDRDGDIDMLTGERSGIYEYIRDNISIPKSNISHFEILGLSEQKEFFLRTDHHWNNYGSYKGYLDILNLLGITDDPIVPVRQVTLSNSFAGSKVRWTASYGLFSEPFIVNEYELPEMKITVNRGKDEYEDKRIWIEGKSNEEVNYENYYKLFNGEVVFDTMSEKNGKILVFGESYDNAILEILATHFDKLYAIDLRYYENDLGEKFVLNDYINEHNIDIVLFNGNYGLFTSDEMLSGD